MCRRNQLLGCVMLGFGLGMIIGYSLESWLLCTCGSVALLVLGFGSLRGK